MSRKLKSSTPATLVTNTRSKRNVNMEEIAESLSPHEQIVFGVLRSTSKPMTYPEVRDVIGIKNMKVDTRLRDLEIRRVVVRGPHRLCTTSGRTCVTWRLSDAPSINAPSRTKLQAKNPLPTAHDVRTFLKELSVLTAVSGQKGARISPQMLKVINWLRGGSALQAAGSQRLSKLTK